MADTKLSALFDQMRTQNTVTKPDSVSVFDRAKDSPVSEDRLKQKFLSGGNAREAMARVAPAIVAGLGEAGIQTWRAIDDIAELAEKNAPLGAVTFSFKEGFGYDKNAAMQFVKADIGTRKLLDQLPQIESSSGKFVKGIVQFAVPMGLWSKALKAKGGITISNDLLRMMSSGAISDFTVFDPHEERLSNLAIDLGFDNALTQYLKADSNISDLENRMRSVLEGAGVGALAEGVIRGARLVRASILARQTIVKEADEVAKQSSKIREDPNIVEELKIRARQIQLEGVRAKKDIFDPVLSTRITKQITEGFKAIQAGDKDLALDILGKLREQRVSRVLGKMLTDGTVKIENIPKTLTKYGITSEQLGKEFIAAASMHGRGLGMLSHYKRDLYKVFGEAPVETKRAIEKLIESESIPERFFNWWVRWENVRRALLVTQVATALRNFASQGGNALVRVFDEALQVPIKGGVRLVTRSMAKSPGMKRFAGMDPSEAILDVDPNTMKGDWKAWMNAGHAVYSRASPKARARFDEVINHKDFPELEKLRLFQTPVHEVALSGSGRGITGSLQYAAEKLNFLNRAQENLWRKIGFEVRLRQNLARRGQNWASIQPEFIGEDDIADAVDFALELSFARTPKNQVGMEFIRAWNKFGGTLVNPFPRFNFFNAVPYVFEHSPLGFIRAFDRRLWREAMRGNRFSNDFIARRISRSMIGTMALGAAWNFVNSEYAGERWYEINTQLKDEQGRDIILDVRAYAPFSVYFFIASAIKDHLDGTNKIKVADYAKIAAGMNRIAGSGLSFIDVFRMRNPETLKQTVQNIVGQYVGSYSVPIRTVKDLSTMFLREEDVVRDVKESKLWAPFVNNIPLLSQSLPPGTSPFEGKQIWAPKFEKGKGLTDNVTQFPPGKKWPTWRSDTKMLGIKSPIWRQISGLSPKSKGIISQEIDKHGIPYKRVFANVGIPEANRIINGYTGQLNELFLKPILESDMYKNMSPPIQRLKLKELASDNKSRALKLMAVQRPDLWADIKESNMDEDTLRLLEAQGVVISDLLKRKN